MEDVIFERDDLQVKLDLAASQLSGACNALPVAREQLQQWWGRSALSHFRLESLLIGSVSGFVVKVARLVTDEGATYRASNTNIVAAARESLEMDSQPIMELLCPAERSG